MPNIGSLLKDEISRLCRREIRREVVPVKKSSAVYRREIASLKRQVVMLERKAALLARRAAAGGDAPATSPDRPVRFVAKGLRTMRTRLGLSATQLAKLIGVSEQSVYNWETKKATPRKKQLAAIIAIRPLGKRDVHTRLEALKPSKRAKAKS